MEVVVELMKGEESNWKENLWPHVTFKATIWPPLLGKAGKSEGVFTKGEEKKGGG